MLLYILWEMGRTKKFLASYYHDGSWWGIHFFAEDFDDAETICKAHNLRLDGEHIVTIPASTGAWFPNLIIRLRNALKRR